MTKNQTTRRDFIQTTGAAGAALVVTGVHTSTEVTASRSPNDKLNIGIIGSGGRGAANLRGVAGENIYALCQHLMDNGVTINRPPRDGRMAFVRSPDNVSIELLQQGDALTPAEPWLSMPNTGSW